jgi:aspartate-semialdehyde dehydrogenase
MNIAVIGARGVVGRACVENLHSRGHTPLELHRKDNIPTEAEGIINASSIEDREFAIPIVDCSGELSNTSLVLPTILHSYSLRLRVPNCMASLIAQAIAPLHKKCTVKSIVATCLQSASGAGWRGIHALEQDDTEEIFGGILSNNILPHENAELEESIIVNDLHELFGCEVTATSFRVPVFTGHVASLQIVTKCPIEKNLIPNSDCIDPRNMEQESSVAIGRVRIDKNTANIVICGNQLTCGTAIPAVTSIIST